MRDSLHRIEQFKLYLSLILMMVVGVAQIDLVMTKALTVVIIFFLTSCSG